MVHTISSDIIMCPKRNEDACNKDLEDPYLALCLKPLIEVQMCLRAVSNWRESSTEAELMMISFDLVFMMSNELFILYFLSIVLIKSDISAFLSCV